MKWTFKVEWECTNMGESSPDPWGMSDLEGYQDSGRDEEHKALLSNKGPGHPAQTQQWTSNPKVYPFTPQDHVMSDTKCFMGPCYACGSGKHWLRDCPEQGEYEELCKKKIMKGPLKAYKVAMFTVEASQDPDMVNPTSEEEGFA